MTVAMEAAPRPRSRSMRRGFLGRCPACGEGRLYRKFLKVADACPRCGEELHHHRADDAPPYFTITAVAHLVIPSVLVAEKLWQPSLAVHAAIFLPATLALTLALMPAIKGAVVGLQWALRMHGFGGAQDA